MAITGTPGDAPPPVPYSVTQGASEALHHLIAACGKNLPLHFLQHTEYLAFTAASPESDMVHFPSPLREQDTMLAIKALEACAAAAVADLRCGDETLLEDQDGRQITVDVDKTSCFLMSAYLTTIDGMGKQHPDIRTKVPGTLIRRLRLLRPSMLTPQCRLGLQPGPVRFVSPSVCQSL